jgi:GT2 family glycosyltransferase
VSDVLTVAIPTYNGRELLEVVLPSLAEQRFRDFRMVVVDDGSTDGTAEWLSRRWPDVEVVVQANQGVTAALNACLRAAAETELVGLFNSDVELDPDCLGELVRALREHPDAGSASPKLLDFHERDTIDGAGDVLEWAGHGHRRGHGERDRGQYDEPQPIFGPCAGAAVYRRSAIEAVGDFDEDFHAFFEDVDWSLRAQLAGFQCRYVPSARVYHMGSATLGAGLTDFARYHLWRNAVWLLAKGMPASLLARHAHQLLAGQLVNLAVALRDRKLGIWLRAWRDALTGLPRILARRRRIQRERRVTPRELAARLDPG